MDVSNLFPLQYSKRIVRHSTSQLYRLFESYNHSIVSLLLKNTVSVTQSECSLELLHLGYIKARSVARPAAIFAHCSTRRVRPSMHPHHPTRSSARPPVRPHNFIRLPDACDRPPTAQLRCPTSAPNPPACPPALAKVDAWLHICT